MGNYYITAGVYSVSGSLHANMAPGNGFGIIGDGAAVTRINFTGIGDNLTVTGNAAANYFAPADRFRIQGLSLLSQYSPSTNNGLSLLRLVGFSASDLFINAFYSGIRLQDSVGGRFSDCLMTNCTNGVYAFPGSLTNPNLHLFSRCSFASCSQYGLAFLSGSALTLESCEFAGNSTGIAFSQAGAGRGAVAVTLAGANYFENNSGQHIYITMQTIPSFIT